MNIKELKIGFIGNMNTMPMQYALKFKEDGCDIKYIVESPKDKMLMRPEIHYKNIEYPYPEWIKEIPFKNKLLNLLFNRYNTRKVRAEMKDCDVIFFNHYAHHLSGYFDDKVIKVALFSGADLDVTCNYKNIDNLIAKDEKLFIQKLKKLLLNLFTMRYRRGIKSCDILSYFPIGMNPVGDKLQEEVMGDKKYIDIRRYDINFKEIGLDYIGTANNDKLVIISAVRFLIKTTKENAFEYKGNDLIIKGIAKFYEVNKNIEVHFVEKGSKENIEIAKKLCKDYGIEDVVVWHKEMTLESLLELYKRGDVMFDQVGTHWSGAIGLYAQYMGKPVIANARLDVFGKIWGDDVKVLNATTVDEIFHHLINCQSKEFREEIGKASHEFVNKHVDSEVVYKKYKAAILDVYHQKRLNK